MTRIRRIMLFIVAAALAGCSGSPTEPTHDEGGTEAGESGTQYAVSDTATEVRAGVRLVISYESARQMFSGTVENTTAATVSQVRVEVHLSNGVELGPTPNVDLAAGQTLPVELDASGQTFTQYSVHVEIGSCAA